MTQNYNGPGRGQLLTFGANSALGRRTFMKSALAAGAVTGLGTGLWPASARAQDQTPKRGGTFRVAIHDGSTTDTLDPGKYSSGADIQLTFASRSYPTEITSDNGLGPDIADSWESNADATVWTFALNQNASFHNGQKFTVKDAIASLNYHRDEKNTSAASDLLGDIKDIRADGDYTLVIELNQAIADLPWILADYHLAMCPAKDDGMIDWEAGIGSGPYKIVSREAGVGVQLVRHDGWHREGAYFDAVEQSIITDSTARLSALITGEVDAVTLADTATMDLLRQNPDIEVDDIPSASAITMPMFCDVAPFSDVNVRLALKYAINRQELIDKILLGSGTVGNDYHIAPTMPYYPDLPQRPYDPDKAKFHLNKAGLSSLDVDLSSADVIVTGAVDMAVLYSEQARPAGINIRPAREPNDGYWSNVWLKKPFIMSKYGARPTPDAIFSLLYKADAAWNDAHWQNERFNELLIQAKGDLNQERRAETYREMAQIASDDGGSIIPIFNNYVYAHSKSVVHGPGLSSAWELDGGRSYQRWWFA